MAILNIIQILLAIIIIILIIMQQRGNSESILFGSQAKFFLQRRGIEKNIYYLTWLLIIIFLITLIF